LRVADRRRLHPETKQKKREASPICPFALLLSRQRPAHQRGAAGIKDDACSLSLGGEGQGEGALPQVRSVGKGPLTRRYAATSPTRERWCVGAILPHPHLSL
jgi:hypothetical protein